MRGAWAFAALAALLSGCLESHATPSAPAFEARDLDVRIRNQGPDDARILFQLSSPGGDKLRDEAFLLTALEQRSYTAELGHPGNSSLQVEVGPESPAREGAQFTQAWAIDPLLCQHVDRILFNETVRQDSGAWYLSNDYAGGSISDLNCGAPEFG